MPWEENTNDGAAILTALKDPDRYVGAPKAETSLALDGYAIGLLKGRTVRELEDEGYVGIYYRED